MPLTLDSDAKAIGQFRADVEGMGRGADYSVPQYSTPKSFGPEPRARVARVEPSLEKAEGEQQPAIREDPSAGAGSSTSDTLVSPRPVSLTPQARLKGSSLHQPYATVQN